MKAVAGKILSRVVPGAGTDRKEGYIWCGTD